MVLRVVTRTLTNGGFADMSTLTFPDLGADRARARRKAKSQLCPIRPVRVQEKDNYNAPRMTDVPLAERILFRTERLGNSRGACLSAVFDEQPRFSRSVGKKECMKIAFVGRSEVARVRHDVRGRIRRVPSTRRNPLRAEGSKGPLCARVTRPRA